MSAPPADNNEVRRHREMLLIAGAVAVFALIFQVRADDRVVVWALPDHPLPHSCPSYIWFGVKCPGCGLTRSIVELVHGHLVSSWRHHRLGWLMAAAILAQFPYRFLALRAGGKPPLGTWFPKMFGYVIILLLLANWAVEMLMAV